jgi:ABC-type multidrug transport system fused ATPase/permease subunit
MRCGWHVVVMSFACRGGLRGPSGGNCYTALHSIEVIEAEPEQDIQAVAQPPKLTGQIQLDGVCFQYDPQSPPVLRDINVNIEAGQRWQS